MERGENWLQNYTKFSTEKNEKSFSFIKKTQIPDTDWIPKYGDILWNIATSSMKTIAQQQTIF